MAAEMTPKGMPRAMVQNIVMSISWKLTGNRSRNSVVISVCVSCERPKSRVSMPFIQLRYWIGFGSSSPISL